MTGRFAPSPTGRMHLGNVYCAVLSWLSARSQGGRWLLRIEDLDPQRSRREYAEQIMDDLQWLGLDWDDEPLWQSERTDLYADYFQRLSQRALVYPCHCRRADLLSASAPHNSDGQPIYPGTCRPHPGQQAAATPQATPPCPQNAAATLQASVPPGPQNTAATLQASVPSDSVAGPRRPSWRIAMPDCDITFNDIYKGKITRNLAREVGDFIVRRSDGVFAYQLAVVVDDALSGVTEVVRGEDLVTSAAQQIFLYQTLGLPVPRFGHVPLLCAPDGRRLCKRDRDMHMGVLRAKYTPQQLLGVIAHKAGLQADDAPTSLHELKYPAFEVGHSAGGKVSAL